MTIDYENGEIVDGAATKVFRSNADIPINIMIEHACFVHHRGCSGGAVNINSTRSSVMKFHDLRFINNSVVKKYNVNSSAVFIILDSTLP